MRGFADLSAVWWPVLQLAPEIRIPTRCARLGGAFSAAWDSATARREQIQKDGNVQNGKNGAGKFLRTPWEVRLLDTNKYAGLTLRG